MNENTWKAWFDGATKGTNPGIRGIGGVLRGPAGELIEISEEIGHGTNNEAEYTALMAVLDAAIQAGVEDLIVYGDSQLVINQVNGAWLIKAKELVPLCKTAISLKAQIPNIKLCWVPRTENVEADALSKKALGVIEQDTIDRAVWMKISEIAKPFGLSAVALGKKMTKAKLRENGKPTKLAIEKGVVLRVPNNFGHDDYWHRQLLPAALREALFLD
ncbi:ribonuclease HI family protein [Propionivibrio dicarboxylicus]|uniref:Ribonuclease HI n=1 Tax=Propionivibrio dicarboxylicus TaxID=83767 RepID=A0A1G8EJE2_9RHOO|nr:ribonuclease HI family protein [Propionivibrio dicarboxylicus]SDH70044.1 ribonuclease HI [Propionivibrio dicarboxylicus]